MLIDTLNNDLKKILADRLDAAELVDFLQIPVEEIIEVFEDIVIKRLHDIADLIHLELPEYDNTNKPD